MLKNTVKRSVNGSIHSEEASSGNQASMLVLASIAALFAAYRVFILADHQIPLFYDEAYYHLWSLTLDWGYYSKPPMVAWLIALTTSFAQGVDWLVKLASPVLYCATALIIALTGNQLYNRQTGFWSGALALLMPIVSFNSLFITTDAPLLFFWSLTFYCFVTALATRKLYLWLAAGIACGFGLLSKYTMIFVPISIVLYLATDRSLRPLLVSVHFWLAAVAAMLIFLPNLIWNAEHQFVSLQHTREISQLDRTLLHPDKLLEFISAQFGVFGLVPMAVLIWLICRKSSYGDAKSRLLLCFTLPHLTVICVQALLTRANANWAAPSFLAATILITHHLLQQRRKKWLYFSLALHTLLMLGLYHYHSVLNLVGEAPSKRNDPYHRILGWPELGAQLSYWHDQYPDAALLSDSRKLLAYLGYYADPQFQTKVAIWNPTEQIRNHYDLFFNLDQQTTTEYLFVAETPLPVNILSRFDSVLELSPLRATVYKDYQRTVHIYYTKGFKGYDQTGSD